MAERYQASGVTLSLESPDDTLLVEAYGDGGFRLMGRRVEGSLHVNEAGFFPFAAETLDEVTPDQLDAVVAATEGLEILIIGTGADMLLLPKPLRIHLEERGVPYDIMSTGAAARTFNVLRIEGRQVAAVLIQVP